jgi:uncharacterized protein (TIGR02391 family)
MTSRLIDAVRRLQQCVQDIGLSGNLLSLPAPKTLLLSGPNSSDLAASNEFSLAVTEPEIVEASRDLVASGHYSFAVQEAFKVVDKFVEEKGGPFDISGTSMMDLAFSPKNPRLYWTDRSTQSEKDEQSGYHRLFTGAMLGIRNPVTHEFNWVDDPDLALELLVFAQHLLRKAKAAKTY